MAELNFPLAGLIGVLLVKGRGEGDSGGLALQMLVNSDCAPKDVAWMKDICRVLGFVSCQLGTNH